MSTRDDFTKRNCPLTTRMFWELEQVFGPVELVAVRENGIEIGEFSDQREGEE